MKNVLLVDDDNVFNFISTRILEIMGIANNIHTAVNGREAIELLKTCYAKADNLPNVVLLDINMPIMDGFQFLEAFKKLLLPDKEMMKIIIVTSSDNPKDMSKAKEFGVTDYLTKPLQMESLRRVLEDVN